MKRLLNKTNGFTLIELLVVILIIGILIAVAAPSFLGQTNKAHDSGAKQSNAIAYRTAKAFAVDNAAGQNKFDGFDNAELYRSEPSLEGKTTVSDVSSDTLSLASTDGGRTCTVTVSAETGMGDQTCSDTAPVDVSPPVSNGPILYSTYDPETGAADIHKVNETGTSDVIVGPGMNPIWSSDKSQIFYTSTDDYTIHVMDADGSNDQSLDLYMSDPDLSPDGTQFVYARGADMTLRIRNADGSGDPSASLMDYVFAPDWSPDGTKIAVTNGASIFVMNADGSNNQTLADGTTPSFSPDGTKIAYSADTGGGWTIHVMDANGDNPSDLGAAGSTPDWSPDGTKIAYANGTIHVMNADGSGDFDTLAAGTPTDW
jgi:prepilin-type N-terminal cleavage/methylation domain-containing protein